jgi:hypothetical protein
LALFAGVTDKTIQRAEAGVRVCEKSSSRIADALGLPPDTFTKQRFMPHPASPEEIQRRDRELSEAWVETHLEITVHELRDVRDVVPLFGTSVYWVDNNNVAQAHRQQFSALSHVIAQANDGAAADLLAKTREFEARGYVVKGAVIEAYFSDRPFEAKSKRLTSYVVAFQKSRGVKDTTPVKGWLSLMKLLKLHGVADANQFPGDETTAWIGRDPLGILSGDANGNHEAF